MAEEDLSDEQLHQLLKDAEQRLKAAKTNALSLPPPHQRSSQSPAQPQSILLTLLPSIPTVFSNKSITPYIKSTSQGAQVDSTLLVSEQQRKASNGIRVVEDPVAIKNKTATVCNTFSTILQMSSMRKIYSNFTDAEFGPVLGTSLQH